MSRTITATELKEKLDQKQDVVLVDVRRKADYEADTDMIPGAVWQDPERVDEWSKKLPKDKEVVIYCVRGGSVSQSVSARLSQEDLHVRYVEGGIAAWKESK